MVLFDYWKCGGYYSLIVNDGCKCSNNKYRLENRICIKYISLVLCKWNKWSLKIVVWVNKFGIEL